LSNEPYNYKPLRQEAALKEDGTPLFVQIAGQVEDSIVDGSLAEEAQAPSTNELASFYRMNPATAAKGINMLVSKGVLYKRRGVGMFVAPGARELLLKERRNDFALRYVQPLLAEARRIGLGPDDVADLVRTGAGEAAAAAPPSHETDGRTP
jgi:DNA-binding transcriptional regulator YhcF (GntR family)